MPTKPRPNKSKEFDALIERVNTEDIQKVSLLLERKGRELLLHCIENPAKLKIKSTDGYALADTFASYAPTDVIKLLLDTAKTNTAVKNVISETHELEGGASVESFTLAIATLRNRKEDDSPYMELAREIKLQSRITED